MENRITKTQKYQMIKEILDQVQTDAYDVSMLIEFVKGEQDALARKAAKAKEKASEKKAETDELGEAVFAKLSDEPMTRDQVADLFNDEDITPAKVGARLNKLVALGRVVKGEVAATSAAGKKTTRMVYSLPVDSDEAAE